MKLVAVGMAKDEADIIGSTVRRMADQVDEVVVLDNGSTDGTRDLLAELPCTVVDDPKPGHRWSECVTRLARDAGEAGADWILPFDADEVWRSAVPLRELLAEASDTIMNVPIFDRVITPDDGDEVDPTVRLRWRRPMAYLRRIAFQPAGEFTLMAGGHGLRYAGGPWLSGNQMAGAAVHHFPVRSFAQFEAKAAKSAVAMSDPTVPRGDSTHWTTYARALKHGWLDKLFAQHFVEDAGAPLLYDPLPAVT